MSKHTAHDLKQLQSLPLEAKVLLTKQRIQSWYEAWKRYEIFSRKTGKTRFVTATEEPPLKEHEYIKSEMDGQVYVGFSGGKDSTVLKHIVDSMYDDVPAVFVNTGLEYPEIQKFVRDVKAKKYDCFNTDIEIVRPEMRFDEVIRRYGYPVGSKEIATNIEFGRKALSRGDMPQYEWYVMGKRISEKTGKEYIYMPLPNRFKPLFEAAEILVSQRCCEVMKKKPSKQFKKKTGRVSIIGTMASESKLRYSKWIKEGCNAFDAKTPKSQPMAFWTEQDVLAYIKKYNVPYCPVYGDIVYVGEDGYEYESSLAEDDMNLRTTGAYRTGCVFCMFGAHLEKGENRFQRLKRTHPRQYEYCIGGGEMVDGKWQPSKEGLGLGKVLDYIGVKY